MHHLFCARKHKPRVSPNQQKDETKMISASFYEVDNGQYYSFLISVIVLSLLHRLVIYTEGFPFRHLSIILQLAIIVHCVKPSNKEDCEGLSEYY